MLVLLLDFSPEIPVERATSFQFFRHPSEKSMREIRMRYTDVLTLWSISKVTVDMS